jgi:hypothetical protein
MSTILTKDEVIRNISELMIENFGSLENFARAYNKMIVRDLKEQSELYDKSHGSFFDRGSADNYYGRPRDPHRGGVGGMSGPRVEAKTADELEAYHAGYDFQEQLGDKKDWG